MKKTFNVNIGSVAFSLNEDAYYTLKGYFADIRSRLNSDVRQDVMEDVESRVADIFNENITFSAQVIDIEIVMRAITIIGSADEFGEGGKSYEDKGFDDKKKSGKKEKATMVGLKDNRLYRSRSDKVIGGVCGGLAESLGIDPTVVRLILVFFFLFGGVGLLVYVVMWIVIPLEPLNYDYFREENSRMR